MSWTSRVAIILILIGASLGLCFRSSNLTQWPDLEHDESLILLGADRIVSGRFTLTGDKVYEGPFVEYLIALMFITLTRSVGVARVVITLFGIMTCALIGFCASRWLGRFAGSFAAILFCCSPWGYMSGRVIYACNTVPFFTFAGLSLVLWMPNCVYSWLIAGMLTGIAMHGHVYSVLILPALIAVALSEQQVKKLPLRVLLLVSGVLISVSPILYYNIYNCFPAYEIFSGSESHSINITSDLWKACWTRWIGYGWTSWAALTGQNAWLDFAETGFPSGILLTPILSGIGLSILIFSKKLLSSFRWPALTWIAASSLVVPLITKHRTHQLVWMWGHPSPPHYLDLGLPMYLILAAVPVSLLWNHRRGGQRAAKWAALLIASIALTENISFTQIKVREQFRNAGGIGRWTTGISEIAQQLEQQNVNTIFASIIFGHGYPQLKFLLPDKNIIPVILTPQGVHDDNGTPIQTLAAFVTPAQFTAQKSLGLRPQLAFPSHTQLWHAYIYHTPYLEFVGVERGSQTSEISHLELVWDKNNGHGHCRIGHLKQIFNFDLTERIDSVIPHPASAKIASAVSDRHKNEFTNLTLIDATHFHLSNGASGEITIHYQDEQYADCSARVNGTTYSGKLFISRHILR